MRKSQAKVTDGARCFLSSSATKSTASTKPTTEAKWSGGRRNTHPKILHGGGERLLPHDQVRARQDEILRLFGHGEADPDDRGAAGVQVGRAIHHEGAAPVLVSVPVDT